MNKIYIVYVYGGEYESSFNEDIKAFSLESDAIEFSDKLNFRLSEMKKKLEDLRTEQSQYPPRSEEAKAVVNKIIKVWEEYSDVSECAEGYGVGELEIV